jgi:phosphatidylinositol alpha-1,6-mannosyltransferase
MAAKGGRVLIVTRNFPPLVGGMERLLYHMYEELVDDFDVALVGPAGCAKHAVNAGAVFECRPAPAWRFLAQCQWKAYRAASRLRPDLIIAGSGVVSPAALIAGRASGAPVLCYLHGLDIIARNGLYQALFVPAIKKCDALVVNSHNTAQLLRNIGVEDSRISILPPGVTLPPGQAARANGPFRVRIGAEKRPILLSVGRLTARKGLVAFVAHVLPRLLSRHPDVVLAIIGSEPELALTAERAGVARNIVFLGPVDDETLHSAYFTSDLLVFPVLDLPGDVEGFGMVAVEAAAHGLPTVAFAAGGVPDAVKPKVSGYLVEPGDYGTFAERILALLDSDNRNAWRSRCMQFAKRLSWEQFGKRWRNICCDVMSRF